MNDDAAGAETARARMLAEGDAVWQQLCQALDTRADAILHQPPEPPWTSRDVYAHLARWQANSVYVVHELLAGRPAPVLEGDDDTINARWAAEDAALTTAAARARCLASREDLRAILLTLTADQWQRFGRRCAEDVNGGHYQEHLDALGA